jgi:hypothetical protein
MIAAPTVDASNDANGLVATKDVPLRDILHCRDGPWADEIYQRNDVAMMKRKSGTNEIYNISTTV